jgi:adenosine deaminase
MPSRPFAELHVHIEGTLEPQLVRSLAARHRVDLPEWGVALNRPTAYRDLQEFLDAYYLSMTVLRTAEDFRDLAAAYFARAAAAGITHAEVFFDPQVHLERGVPLEAVLEGLVAAGEDARATGMTVGWIACLVRHLGGDAALDTVQRLRPYRDVVTGIGLDSTELGFPPQLFQEAFALARAEGFRITAHAGEEGGPEVVRDALDLLGAERIDHGIRVMEDPELVRRLADEQVPLTVCPISNVLLQAVPSIELHPLPAMLDAGLLVSVNSDDPAYFHGYLEDNLAVLPRMGLTEAHIDRLAANSFASVFVR